MAITVLKQLMKNDKTNNLVLLIPLCYFFGSTGAWPFLVGKSSKANQFKCELHLPYNIISNNNLSLFSICYL